MVIDTSSTMSFDYSETQQMVLPLRKEFAEQYIRPYVMEWDEEQIPSRLEVFKKAGEMGFMGVLVPGNGWIRIGLSRIYGYYRRNFQGMDPPLDYLWLHIIHCVRTISLVWE